MSDHFDWSGEDVVLRCQPAVAVYLNPHDEVVIRQGGLYDRQSHMLDANTDKPRTIIDIEKAAQFTIREDRRRGACFAKWQPMPENAFERAERRPSTAEDDLVLPTKPQRRTRLHESLAVSGHPWLAAKAARRVEADALRP
jgi:hypothetical protein